VSVLLIVVALYVLVSIRGFGPYWVIPDEHLCGIIELVLREGDTPSEADVGCFSVLTSKCSYRAATNHTPARHPMFPYLANLDDI